MKDSEIQEIEIQLFIEALRLRHEYDFSNYAKASLRRRIRDLLMVSGDKTIADMIPRVLHDKDFLTEVITRLSVQVSEMFRDPEVYLKLRQEVIPVLKTYPQINIWLAGCATGEEAYSIAVLLKEEALLNRAHIYATDINEDALKKAEEGVYPLDKLKDYTRNYQKSGGEASFSDYYHARYEFAKMDEKLKDIILFSRHNLVTDGVFCEANLIMCRNVFIYFNKELQDSVLHVFHDCLARGGFLCLGTKESIQFSAYADYFKPIARKERIFQKMEKGSV